MRFGDRRLGAGSAWVSLVLAGSLVSCSGPRNFVQRDVDWGYYRRIGIAPFQNLTSDRTAGAKVTSSFLTELLITQSFEVAEPGSFSRALNEVMKAQGINDPNQLSAAELKLLGEKAQVQAILFGTVREYAMTRSGQDEFPLVSVDLRLVDAPTGNLLWAASLTRQGGPKLPFLSIGETRTLGQMSQEVCEKLATSLAGNLR